MLQHRGIDFKIVSDMVRYEGPKKTPNYEAGIDLMAIFYNKYGLTTPILIFCGDEQRARANI